MEGRILCYRMFDVGPDFNLSVIEERLNTLLSAQRAKFSKPTRALIIKEAPLVLPMGGYQFDELKFDLQVKIWPFGVISVLFVYHFNNHDWEDLVDIGVRLENDDRLLSIARDKASQILMAIDPDRKVGMDIVEDYLIYFFKKLPQCEDDLTRMFQYYDVARLLLGEKQCQFGPQVNSMIKESLIQYSKEDAYVVTWNSALVVEPSDSFDVPDVIEFALCQVLEMRYYDLLLERKLVNLYSALERRRWNVFENQAERSTEEAAKYYLEVSETVENVNNSLKVIGDFYLAQIFRAASQRFRFQDWRDSVSQKLKNLTEISSLISNQVNVRRGHLLELIIIILIAIEVVPFLIRLLWQ
ncbi:MAG: hypothetical protein NZ480_08265 [Bdellovibrionaceae bacterium]|nr:hypothetical protein [Pseudobdellovibrionaceae bacterium]MDW8190919.1 hypothetical protein [Pseudobdellovibrionaceae bacterium]